ncbi:MAG: hypothetical protein EZS28_036733 [Streblomastix strix]|uniref:Uncharacterized protein n=1 Tax=Streblomastix strix TaxID=222440 RepID=A0A5J4UCV2_9EUKA|nr:MAG: hypothetical protein EZS28_036733 [Streblomastix strix]
MDPEQFANLFWQPDEQPADKRRISLWLNSILSQICILGTTANSFKHATSIELARQGLNTAKLNILSTRMYFQELQVRTTYVLLEQRLKTLRLSSWEVMAEAALLQPSRNNEVEQLNRVIQIHCQGITSNILIIVRYNVAQMFYLMPYFSIGHYPSEDELIQLAIQKRKEI